MAPKKPVDVPPVELMGGLFGSLRPATPAAPGGWRGRLAKLEAHVADAFTSPLMKRAAQALAVVVLVAIGGTGWHFRDLLIERATTFVANATGAVVDRIVVSGAVYTGKDELQKALGLEKGASLVGFDAAAARARLEALPWIRLASVERKLPDTVEVSVYEHVPLARVVADGQIWVINKDGERIIADGDNRFPGLPLLQGDGAAKAAGALFATLANWPQLLVQLREAQWVGGRRWDLRFVSGVVVQLPEETADFGPMDALPLLAKLEEARHVLTLNAGQVDLRLPDRVVLRLPDTVGATPVTSKPAVAG